MKHLSGLILGVLTVLVILAAGLGILLALAALLLFVLLCHANSPPVGISIVFQICKKLYITDRRAKTKRTSFRISLQQIKNRGQKSSAFRLVEISGIEPLTS